jgi:hypothetical protein
VDDECEYLGADCPHQRLPKSIREEQRDLNREHSIRCRTNRCSSSHHLLLFQIRFRRFRKIAALRTLPPVLNHQHLPFLHPDERVQKRAARRRQSVQRDRQQHPLRNPCGNCSWRYRESHLSEEAAGDRRRMEICLASQTILLQ